MNKFTKIASSVVGTAWKATGELLAAAYDVNLDFAARRYLRKRDREIEVLQRAMEIDARESHRWSRAR